MNQTFSLSHTTNNIFFKYAYGNIGIYDNIFHSDFEILFITQGDITCIYQNESYRIKPYTLIIIPPGTYHQFIPENGGVDYERFVFEFPVSKINPLFSKEDLEKKQFIQLKEGDEIIRLFRKFPLYYSHFNEKEFEILFQSLFNEILLLVRHTDTQFPSSSNNLNNITKNTLIFISEHFKEKIQLTSLAKSQYCSVSSLCHHFKKDLGISINQFIIRKRLIGAQTLLHQGIRPNEVWGKCGFPDYACFFRMYKKYFKISPSEDFIK